MKISRFIERTLTDYPGHTACTVFTGGCNFRCPYCNHKLTDKDAQPVISEEDFFRFLDRQAELKTIDSVVITGGEPTIQAELPDFIRHIKGYYGFKVKLCTNASNITMIDEILCEGMIDYIAMDIKSGRSGFERLTGIKPEEDVFSSITGCFDLFEGKFEGLPIFPYEFRTIVVGGLHQDEDFREIGELLHGIKRYVLQYYKPCSKANSDHNASLEQNSALSGKNNASACKKCTEFYTPTREDMLRFKSIVAPNVGEVIIRHLDMN